MVYHSSNVALLQAILREVAREYDRIKFSDHLPFSDTTSYL
jgi:hypothetical protein